MNARGIRLFAADYPHDYPEVEAAVMVVRHRLRIKEVPVRMREREVGSSSITTLRSLYYAVKVTLALFIGIFRRRVVPVRRDEPVTPLRVSIAATIASILLILVVLELIRSRRLRERYALLWLATGVVLLVLSAWREASTRSPAGSASPAIRRRCCSRSGSSSSCSSCCTTRR